MSVDGPSTADDARDLAMVVDDLRSQMHDLREEVVDARAERDALADRLEDVEEERDQLAERVDELEREREESATVRWDSPNPAELEIEAADGSNSVNPFLAITSKADTDDVEAVAARVDALERGEVDPTELVAGGAEATLPIERDVADVVNGLGNTTANQERATHVFRAFGGRARSWNGKMKLDSSDVRSILEDPEKAAMNDVNRNTVVRTMHQCAKRTSAKPDGERDATDEENLITLQKGGKRLELVADKDEWQDFIADVEERAAAVTPS